MPNCELPEAFTFCPRCGNGRFRPRPDRKVILCPACGYQHFINSVLAAGVAIEEPDHGRLILVRRQREPAKGKLGLPGGFSDANESAEEVARREVREEVNLELGPLHYLTSYPNRYIFQGLIYPTTDVFFTAQALSMEPLRALEDVQEIVLRAPREIAPEELAFDSLRHALRCYLERTT
jgi:ADP-ribose pyrophosphatase YjhB (NUDIX family)